MSVKPTLRNPINPFYRVTEKDGLIYVCLADLMSDAFTLGEDRIKGQILSMFPFMDQELSEIVAQGIDDLLTNLEGYQ